MGLQTIPSRGGEFEAQKCRAMEMGLVVGLEWELSAQSLGWSVEVWSGWQLLAC